MREDCIRYFYKYQGIVGMIEKGVSFVGDGYQAFYPMSCGNYARN